MERVFYENIHFVSREPHPIKIIARLGVMVDGSTSYGSAHSSFDHVPEEEAVAEFEEFKKTHGGDWIMVADMVGFMDNPVRIK